MDSTKNLYEKYQVQMQLPGFGEQSQQLLASAKVLVIGAGGLGCPCLQYLTAAGVGNIGICDSDIIALSNLHRQILYSADDVEKNKTTVAILKLQQQNPTINFIEHNVFITPHNAIEILSGYDIIVDCTDDLRTRYLINDICFLLQKPLVYGAIFQYEGQVAVFNTDEKKINLHDVFEHEANKKNISCNEYGAIGTVTGMIGSIQAMETIKWITKIDTSLHNALLCINFLSYNFYKINISPSEKNRKKTPQTVEEFLQRKYTMHCNPTKELSQQEFLQKIKNENVQVIDVRNEEEAEINFFSYEKIPLATLMKNPEMADRTKTILLFCHAGIRSLEALEFLEEEHHITNIFHLKGGIVKWNEHE